MSNKYMSIANIVTQHPVELGWGITVSLNRETITLRGIPVSSENLGVHGDIDIEDQIYYINMDKDTYIAVLNALKDYGYDDTSDIEVSSYDEQDSDFSVASEDEQDSDFSVASDSEDEQDSEND